MLPWVAVEFPAASVAVMVRVADSELLSVTVR